MKLKLQKLYHTNAKKVEPLHKETVSALGWLDSEEILSAADDQQLLKWNVTNGKSQTITTFKEKIYPTMMKFAPKIELNQGIQQTNNRNAYELFIISSTDGKIYLINTSGKTEKVFDAHQGAVLSAKWSCDGSGFVTSGEDGTVKLWSRSGMLRSLLAQNGRPSYAADWNPQATKIAYCNGEECFIKMLKAQVNPIKWKAHQSTVLCLEWSTSNDLIITGGEDCKYRIWDALGRPIYSSDTHYYPITSLQWSPNGDLFAVGSFNILRLCDKAGWSHSMEKHNHGSIYGLSWSLDGTQIVAGCANGSVLHAQIIEKRLIWENLEAVQIKRKSIEINDVSSDVSREKLDTRDQIIKFNLGFNYLVVATIKQCYIYSIKNWNTPVIIDLKEGSISLILLSEKFFLMVDGISIQIYNFEGRVQCQIRMPGTVQSGEPLNDRTASLSNDVVAIRDRTQHSVVHLFSTQTGNIIGDGKFVHTVDIVQISINKSGALSERRVAIVDENNDCFLFLINRYGAAHRAQKIGSVVSDLAFNNTTNMLAGFQDRKLVVWTVPTIVFTDKDNLSKTILELDNSIMDKSAFIIGYFGNTINVRRADGCLLKFYVPSFLSALINCVQSSNWDQAVRICRIANKEYLWGTLAGMSAIEKNYAISKVCYAELLETDKVLFLHEICTETNNQLKTTLMTLFNGQWREADISFVKNGNYFQAIMLNLVMFKFDRALDLALKYKIHLDTVLGYRQKYLEKTGRKENDPKFLKQMAQVEIDWQHIHENIKLEKKHF